MTERDNTNRGAAWKNDKSGNENWPDYRGNVNVEGKEFWFDCWIKTIQQGDKKGQKFLSFSVKPKMAREHKGGTANPPAPRAEAPQSEFDDKIHF